MRTILCDVSKNVEFFCQFFISPFVYRNLQQKIFYNFLNWHQKISQFMFCENFLQFLVYYYFLMSKFPVVFLWGCHCNESKDVLIYIIKKIKQKNKTWIKIPFLKLQKNHLMASYQFFDYRNLKNIDSTNSLFRLKNQIIFDKKSSQLKVN